MLSSFAALELGVIKSRRHGYITCVNMLGALDISTHPFATWCDDHAFVTSLHCAFFFLYLFTCAPHLQASLKASCTHGPLQSCCRPATQVWAHYAVGMTRSESNNLIQNKNIKDVTDLCTCDNKALPNNTLIAYGDLDSQAREGLDNLIECKTMEILTDILAPSSNPFDNVNSGSNKSRQSHWKQDNGNIDRHFGTFLKSIWQCGFRQQ